MNISFISAIHLDDSKNIGCNLQSYCRMGQLPNDVCSEERMMKTELFILLFMFKGYLQTLNVNE